MSAGDEQTVQAPDFRPAPPEEVAPRYGVGRLTRHVLVCAGPSCCDSQLGAQTWAVFKRRLSELGLTGFYEDRPAVFRTLCQCLRICGDGPIVVVYPEGAWYRGVTPEAAERIVREHLVGGKVVEELLFARDPLAGTEPPLADLSPPAQPDIPRTDPDKAGSKL